MRLSRPLLALSLVLVLSACRSSGTQPPIQPVHSVDLSRYMGRWYVIASIPTMFDRNADAQIENYRLGSNGKIHTTFSFHRGSLEGPPGTLRSTATVVPGSGNALWEVKFFWLLHEQYIVAWLAPEYSEVIVARDARDYVWLMARTPEIPAADYQRMLARVKAMGYDLSKLRKIPQPQRLSAR